MGDLASSLRGIACMNDKGPGTVGRMWARDMRKAADVIDGVRTVLERVLVEGDTTEVLNAVRATLTKLKGE